MAQVLEMQFETADGQSLTISVDAPKANLSTAQVYGAMDTIIKQDVFHKDGMSITSIKGARIVERNVTNFDLSLNS